MELTSTDYEILKFIEKFESVHENAIFKAFPTAKYATLERLQTLEENNLIAYETELIFIEGIPHDSSTDICKVSFIGCKILQDYAFTKKQKQVNKLEDRIWRLLPIVLSVIALLKSYGWLWAV